MVGEMEKKTFAAAPLEDTIDAPTIHVDGAQGMIANNHVIRFNLVTDCLVIPEHSDASPVRRTTSARLVMSREVFFSLADWLKNNADAMEKLPYDEPGSSVT